MSLRSLPPAAALALMVLAAAAPAADPAAPPLTLDEAVARVLAASPELQAARHRLAAAEHARQQATQRPNPALELEWENLAGTGELAGVETSETSLLLAWPLELSGQREARTDAATAVRQMAAAVAAADTVRVTAGVRQAYVAVQAAAARHRLASRQLAVDQAMLAALRQRVAAGAASSLDTLRAGLARDTTALAVARRQAALQASRRALARLWGAVDADFTTPADSLSAGPPPRPHADLLADLATAPPLAVAEQEAAAARAAVAVAERARGWVLDVAAGARLEHATGDRGLVLGVAAPLPLLDRNAAGADAARAEVAAAVASARAIHRDLAITVGQAADHLAALHAEVRTLEENLLPAAAAAYAEARRHLERGRLALTDVLEVRGNLLALQERRLDLLADYHDTAAAVTAMTGRPALQTSPRKDRS